MRGRPPRSTTRKETPKGGGISDDEEQGNGENGVVSVVNAEKLERRAVKLGGHGNDGQQVIGGRNAGEKIVSGDLTKLSDGLSVKIAE